MSVPYRPASGDIPTQPGVYRFRDATGRVLYVGKAKNLRARLSNYFAPPHTLLERTRHLVTTATSVDWTVVASEVEALQLEITWINREQPPYNVRFKDDKSYPYLVVTLGEEAPRAMITRRRGIRGAKYFGPYPKMWALEDTLRTLVSLLPIRTCKDSDYRRAMQSGRACFASQIGRCFGPCSGRISIPEHRAAVDRFVAFLQRPDPSIIDMLTAQMEHASAALDFETAAVRRDQVRAARAFFETRAMVLADNVDLDAHGLAHDALQASLYRFVIRGGRVDATHVRNIDTELDLAPADLMASILEYTYQDTVPPPEIVVPMEPTGSEALTVWLTERAGRRVVIRVPHRGDKATLLASADENARQNLARYRTQRTADYAARRQSLEDLQEALGLAEAPLRIECYDISHLAGTNVVGSMVVFEDGLARRDQYRTFSVARTTDDTDSVYQVLRRRLAHLVTDDPDAPVPAAPKVPDAPKVPPAGSAPPAFAATPAPAVTATPAPPPDIAPESSRRPTRFAYRPNLLLIDGGAPQVAAAARAVAESSAPDLAVCGIAKRLEELWLPGSEFPVILPRNGEALFLLQRLRDEAHRVAITRQRGRRSRDLRTELQDIPGLGEVRVSVLLRTFGSMKRLRAASVAELATVDGIGPALAETIHRHLAAPTPTATEDASTKATRLGS